MKWSEISKAKNIEFNKPLFLKDENPLTKKKDFYIGKLLEKKQTKEGLIHTFEVAMFDGDPESPLFLTTEITHFIVPK